MPNYFSERRHTCCQQIITICKVHNVQSVTWYRSPFLAVILFSEYPFSEVNFPLFFYFSAYCCLRLLIVADNQLLRILFKGSPDVVYRLILESCVLTGRIRLTNYTGCCVNPMLSECSFYAHTRLSQRLRATGSVLEEEECCVVFLSFYNPDGRPRPPEMISNTSAWGRLWPLLVLRSYLVCFQILSV